MQFKDHPLRLLHRNIEIKFHLRYFSHISAASSFSSARITFPWPLILIFFFQFNIYFIPVGQMFAGTFEPAELGFRAGFRVGLGFLLFRRLVAQSFSFQSQ